MTIDHLIQQIHKQPHRTVVAIAGAGSSALMHLLGIPGASQTLLEAIVPYSQMAFDDFLGKPPRHYVSEMAGRLLAGRAYTRARQLATNEGPLIGVACTAALTTQRAKRGAHRGHVATWQPHALRTYSVILEKGARSRAQEEAVYSTMTINALAKACDLAEQLPLPLSAQEIVEEQVYDFASVAQQLHESKLDYFALNDHGRIRTKDVSPQTILSGSFNPCHDGHLGMAQAALRLLERPVAFELSAFNVDKPPIPPGIVLNRVAQFAGRYPIYVSNAPTYIAKSRLYPGATFVIGYDTAIRLFKKEYYGDSQAEMERAMAEIAANGCSFLVAGRADGDGVYYSLADVAVPHSLRHLFAEIPEELFRLDISSTQLRKDNQPGSR